MPSRPLHSARLLAAATAALALAACADSPVPVQPDADAPSLARDQGRGRVIPGRFIVQLEPRTNAREVARGYGVAPDHVYETAIVGFAGSISEAARAGLMRDSRVVRIEQDQVVSAFDTQTGATWGLDRIDQRSLPLSGSYSYENDGSGVTAYILDTGIRSTHNEFTGRVGAGADFVNVGTQPDDCNGHGTHVAGTVGGTRYGVAKGVTLVAVRVLDCQGNGTWAGVIAGIDWVAANHDSPAVANMSLGGGASASVDAAVQNAIASGVTFSVAAGNGDRLGRQQDACNYSPARVAAAITVGATSSNDAKASFSNYGNCVDFFAPGVSITSAWYNSNTATSTISGTSMAAPHVAGAAARYLQSNGGASPSQVRNALYDLTTKGVVSNSSTANNHLLYMDPGDVVTPPPPPDEEPPSEGDFTLSGSGYKVKGVQHADLSWSGASGTNVEIHFNGGLLQTTQNDGSFTHSTGRKGGGSSTYKVCETGTSTCSAVVTVTY